MSWSTNQKGLVTEMEVKTCLVKLGYTISVPLNQDSKYDCILDLGGHLLRVQIKTSHPDPRTKGAIQFHCSSTTVNRSGYKTAKYKENEIDFFATSRGGKVYLVPFKDCLSTTKTLHLIKDKVRGKRAYLEDYEAGKILRDINWPS